MKNKINKKNNANFKLLLKRGLLILEKLLALAILNFNFFLTLL